MKLLRLDLLSFGPFTNLSLDFDKSEKGLHLIYGQNEAGKSSSLSALRQLFYGIEERTSDAFRHPYERLRIGAKIRHSDGAVLEFIRRKARNNSLRSSDDKSIIDPTELDRFLGGVEIEQFRYTFGIDHPALIAGGKKILKGEERFGLTLFAAASGIQDLRGVQKQFDEEMRALYLPNGRRKINRGITELRESQKKTKQLQLADADWRYHDQALTDARDAKAECENKLQQLRRDHYRLARMRDVQPSIAKRKELLAQLQSYADAVLLPADFSGKRQESMTDLRLAEDQGQRAENNLEILNQGIPKLDVPESLLLMAEKIEQLHKRLGRYEKDIIDRSERVLQRKTLEHEAKEILKSLGKPPELDAAEQLRLRADEPLKIQNLGNEYQGLAANLDNARQTVADRKRRLERAEKELDALDSPQDPVELRQAVRLLHRQGDLESELQSEGGKYRQAEELMELKLAKMAPWTGTIDSLEKLSVPATETIDQHDKERAEITHSLKSLRQRLDEEKDAVREVELQLERLELVQEVPTEEDLKGARRIRDDGWQLVRKAWLQNDKAPEAISEFMKSIDHTADLAEAYEKSVERSDNAADRLRWEANRVATKANLQVDRKSHAARFDELAAAVEKSDVELHALNVKWSDLWRPLGLDSLSPQEIRGWLRNHADLLRDAQQFRELNRRVTQLENDIATHRDRFAKGLQAVGEAPSANDESLFALLDRAGSLVQKYDSIAERREELKADIAEFETNLAEADSGISKADKTLKQWKFDWTKAVNRVGLEPDAKPAAVNAFLAEITKLFQKLHEADGFRRRIEGIDRDSKQFADDVRALTADTAPDLSSLPVEKAVEKLNLRLKNARSLDEKRKNLLAQKSKEEKTLEEANAQISAATITLEQLCAEAHCAEPKELPDAEARSAIRQKLENDLRQNEDHILTLSGGAALDAFIKEAEGFDVDKAEADLQAWSQEIASLEQETSKLDQTIGAEEVILNQMGTSAAAAEENERRESLLAQLRSDTEEYVRLRLAAVILREGIRRYREKYQGPVLQRASRLFSILTANSFAELQVDYDDQGEPVLIGIRSGSQEQVPVEGMSEGSCDQLYLALRLGFLEFFLDNHEPIPFIVDDVLLNFDDERAVAALKALADLSKRTQVIFFTHHQHLVALAEENLDDNMLFTHSLPYPHVSAQTA